MVGDPRAGTRDAVTDGEALDLLADADHDAGRSAVVQIRVY
jgi:hypothetical protein